ADLTFELSGGSGNADLYVLFDGRPSTSVFDCESSGSSNSESCSFPVPEAGWYLVMVYGSDAYSGASLVGSYIDPSSTELINDVPADGLASAAGSHSFYTLEVPAEATDLSFVLSGGTGDADLYVRFHTWPSTTRYNCRSWESGNDESCSFPAPLIGTWYVLVYGYETYSGASLKASYTVPVGGGELSNGIPKTDLLGDAGSRLFYTLEVPPGATDLSFVLSGGTGDADLYGLFGTRPSLLSYKCHSWNNGNDESCWFPKPQAGTYHVMVYGYTSYSGVSLMASYVEAVALYNGVPVNDLAGDDESETLYFVEVPEEASDLTITLSGGSGDADLYGRFGVPPDLSLLIYDCHSWNLGNNDSCSYPEPQVGRYYVLVHGYDEYSGANLEASFTEPAVAGELINGAPVNELEGANESETFYTFDVPPGATDLTLNLVGGSGDADLYVRFGLHPSTSDYDCRSRDDGNGDSCSFPEPQAGTWYVLVYGYSSYSGASLTASYTASGGELSNGVPETDLSGATDSQIFYTLEVPAGVVGLTFETSGGTGDADLYVMFGAPPSTTAYDCESGNIDNIESCSFPESQAGTYHVLVYADKNYSGASLVASYTETAIFSDGFESGDTTAWSDRQP
ncbi:MAG: peptidase, partial [bacterium]|nr:peptidase [bacterium]